MKKKIVNTEKTATIENVQWLFGRNPNSIEAQEVLGQRQLLESSQLPSKLNRYTDIEGLTAKQVYEKMGIEVVGTTEGDEMFLDVVLPDGWVLKGTGHPMWSKLIDNRGRERLSIFYKAAFYDREAFANVVSRFDYCEDDSQNSDERTYDSYIRYSKFDNFCTVKDGEKVIFTSSKRRYDKVHTEENHRQWWDGLEKMRNELKQEAINWLNENYPDWKNPFAYFD